MSEFVHTEAYRIIIHNPFPLTEWISESNMTDEQKKENPKFFVMNGFLKVNTYEYACKKWWESLNDNQRKVITSLPKFDKKVFKEVTEIEL